MTKRYNFYVSFLSFFKPCHSLGFSRKFAVAITVFTETAVVNGTTFLLPSLPLWHATTMPPSVMQTAGLLLLVFTFYCN